MKYLFFFWLFLVNYLASIASHCFSGIWLVVNASHKRREINRKILYTTLNTICSTKRFL